MNIIFSEVRFSLGAPHLADNQIICVNKMHVKTNMNLLERRKQLPFRYPYLFAKKKTKNTLHDEKGLKLVENDLSSQFLCY